jgi:hypothetical protein
VAASNLRPTTLACTYAFPSLLASLPPGGLIGGLVFLRLRGDTVSSNSVSRETFGVSSCLLLTRSGVDTVDGTGSGVTASGNVVSDG